MGRAFTLLALIAALSQGAGCVSPEANTGSNDPPAAAAPCQPAQPTAPAPTPVPAPMPAPVMPQPAPVAPPAPTPPQPSSLESYLPWQGYQYPIAAGELRGVHLYRVFQAGEGNAYTARVGLVLEAAPGAYVQYHRSMLAFGDRIVKTEVIASGDAGPDGFPECGRYVQLRHTFTQPIPGIGGSVDTLYCGLELRDAHTVVGTTVQDDAPDGGVILGTVTRRDDQTRPPRLDFFVLAADGAGQYNTLIGPLGLLRPQ